MSRSRRLLEAKRLTVTLRFESASIHEGGDRLVAETDAGVVIAKTQVRPGDARPQADRVFIAELVDTLHHQPEE